MDSSTIFASARDRILRLDADRAAVVALACAQRLAAAQADLIQEIAAAVAAQWDRGTDAAERQALADGLEQRPDADEDVVATTVYSLRASRGSLDDAWWAVSRFIDTVAISP